MRAPLTAQRPLFGAPPTHHTCPASMSDVGSCHDNAIAEGDRRSRIRIVAHVSPTFLAARLTLPLLALDSKDVRRRSWSKYSSSQSPGLSPEQLLSIARVCNHGSS